MSNSTVRSLGLIGFAFLLGIVGDVLLRVPWGINLPIWLGLAVASTWALRPDSEDPGVSRWPVVTALLFTFFIALRDSDFLTFWNLLTIMATLSLPLLQRRGVQLGLATVWDYTLAGPVAAVSMLRGFLTPIVPELAWGELGRFRNSIGPVAIGGALSIPVLFVFGGLLVSADAGFAGVINNFFRVDYEVAFGHVALTGAMTWFSAGYLASFVGETRRTELALGISRPQLGIVEIGLPLATVALVFTAFLFMQSTYLFGGESAMNAAGLTYAEYAREGFVQMVLAATLVLPLLLGTGWLFNHKRTTDTRIYRTLSISLVVLVALVMLSALHRIVMYVGQYGLSEIRLYATVFMFWIGTVNVILVGTVLRGNPARFAFGSLASGIVTLAALNLANPEAIIARSQIEKAIGGATLDAEYLSRLSADAVPTLVENISSLDDQAACEIWSMGIQEWTVPSDSDWRSWNLARRRALESAAGAPAPDRTNCKSPEPTSIPG